MQQEITSEFLKSLYNRANQFVITKFGSEPDRITIDCDGTLTAIFDGYERGDEVYETIKAEDLTSDLDAVAKERAEKLEQERIKREAYNKEQERLKAIREKQERKKQFLILKEEFEP